MLAENQRQIEKLYRGNGADADQMQARSKADDKRALAKAARVRW